MKSNFNLPIAYIGEESSTEIGGRGGISLVETTTDYNNNLPVPLPDKPPAGTTQNDIIDLLISLGDEMDASGEVALANFADFLIKKTSEIKKIDFEQLFNEILLKINNADIVHTNDILKKLAKIYSRTILLQYQLDGDLQKAKESAYKKVLNRADQYLTDEG